MEENNQFFIDIGELTTTMSTKLGSLQPISGTCCIFRAPKRLRLLDKEAYNPRSVPIGPYHHGKKEFKRVEEYKQRYLQFFLQRSNTINLKELIRFVAKEEKKLRDCYGEIIEMSSQVFVEMILVDAIFIIELFLRGLVEGAEDFVIGKGGHVILSDLLLVENQIPFFIMEDLFEQHVHNCGERKKVCFRDLAGQFSMCMHFLSDSSTVEEVKSSQEIKHLIDFARIWSKPSIAERERNSIRNESTSHPVTEPSNSISNESTCPPATELQQAGVKFKVRKDRSSIFDIKFSNGVLEIPPFFIDAETETKLLNILALEQCRGMKDNFYNDYICFMNLLSNSPKDIELLMQKGILKNVTYDSKWISDLFRRLAEAFCVNPASFYYLNLVQELNEYCIKRTHKWKAMLKENYFSNPWTIISVIAATVLLILTLIQTVCSVIQL